MLDEILLAVTVSLDTFLFSASYSDSGIRIPLISSLIINLICGGIMGFSLLIPEFFSEIISPDTVNIAGTVVMTILGVATVFKSLIRNIVRKLSDFERIPLKMCGMNFVVNLYLDDTAADIDNSKVLSPLEAVTLSIAASLDSAALGLGCGNAEINPFNAAVLTFAVGLTAVFSGGLLGEKISSLNHDFSWMGGILLIILAFVL